MTTAQIVIKKKNGYFLSLEERSISFGAENLIEMIGTMEVRQHFS